MGGGQLKRGKSTFWSKFILLFHLTDHSNVHKISLITKITKKIEFFFKKKFLSKIDVDLIIWEAVS